MLAYQSATRADFPEVSDPATTLFSGCLTRRIVMKQCDSATGTGAFSLNSTRIVLIFLAILAGKVLSGVDGLSHASVWLMRQDGVDHPVEAPEFAQATCEGLRFGKIGEIGEEPQLAGPEGVLQLLQEQPAEQPREDAHRQEEAEAARDPAGAVK